MAKGLEIQERVQLANYTTWRVGGFADYFCLPVNVEQVQEALRWAEQKKVAVTVLGGGSNVLISDKGIEGLVLCTQKLTGVQVTQKEPDFKVECMAGTPKSEALKAFLQFKLAPAHFLCGLPGDIGGGVVMNAGVGEAIVPREFVEIVDWVEVATLTAPFTIKRFFKKDLKWSYRQCTGWEPGVVVKVGLIWPYKPEDRIMDKIREATRSRVAKQPLSQPSCGSVFKNPDGHKAGALIEQCGLKGFGLGSAQVSLKHANFIVNMGGAYAADIDRVIQHVRKSVKDKLGVELQTEVKYLGRWVKK